MHDFYIALQTDNMAVTHDNITRMSASTSTFNNVCRRVTFVVTAVLLGSTEQEPRLI